MSRIFSHEWLLAACAILFGVLLCLLADFFVLSHLITDEDTIRLGIYQQYDHGWYALKPNLASTLFGWRRIYHVSTDSHGFRINPRETPSRPVEFLFLGDSFTFGQNGPWQETFAGIFEIQSHKPIVNGGVPSYSPTPYLYQYQKALATGVLRRPHNVIVGIDISDVQDEAAIWRDGEHHPERTSYKSELRQFISSHFVATKTIYRYFRDLLSDPFSSKNPYRSDIRSAFTWKKWSDIDIDYSPLGVSGGLHRIRTKLRAISELAHSNGGRVWILIYPWPAQLKHKSSVFDWEKYSRDLCTEIRCEGVIDTFPKFQPSGDWYRRFYVPGDVHFNKVGNEVIANQLLDTLIK